MDQIRQKKRDEARYVFNDFDWCKQLFQRNKSMPLYRGVKAEKYNYCGLGHQDCVLWFD